MYAKLRLAINDIPCLAFTHHCASWLANTAATTLLLGQTVTHGA